MRTKNTHYHARQEDVETIFHQALQRRTPSERRAYLDGACGSDAQLYAKVEALLQAHDEAGDFLIAETSERPIEGIGARIGRYKILEMIGEGGFGTVYMAEQLEPVRRKVALKIIKLGMDTKQVIARFEAERQALALMDHQNIAKVFDAGSTESGRPYFVMELVRGVSITDYCDRKNLNSHDRLQLFIAVCHAVQHAHQKGIIHRDIKPSNVMITLHDGRPVPKIIDFGVSKATNQRLTEKYAAAEDLLHESIRIWKRTQGPDDSNVSIALTRLGELSKLKGDEAAAERAFRQAVAICENRNDVSSLYFANALTGLSGVLQSQSNYEEAETAIRRTLAIRREVAPQQKLEIALALNRLANVLSVAGKATELEPVLDETIAAFREAMPTNQAVIAKVLTQSAVFYIDQKNFEKAETQLREALEIYRADPTASKFYREVALQYLSLVINQRDDNSLEYVAKRRQYLNFARDTLGKDHPKLGLLLSDYSRYMVDHDQSVEAIELATDALEKLDKTIGLETYVKGAMNSMEAAARKVALNANGSDNDYQAALNGVELLIKRQSPAEHLTVVHGALEYRLKRYTKSLDTLTDVESESNLSPSDGLMVHAFMATAHHQLGQLEKARQQLQQLKEQLQMPKSSEIDFGSELLAEVELVLAAASPTHDPAAKVADDKSSQK